MAMELLFENHTQLDEDIIHHIIEKNYKRPEKAKQYHVMTLLVGILAALAAVYFGRLGILTHQMLTLLCTIALIAVCIYSFYSYYQNMPKNQIKTRQNTYSESLLIPRKMKFTRMSCTSLQARATASTASSNLPASKPGPTTFCSATRTATSSWTKTASLREQPKNSSSS